MPDDYIDNAETQVYGPKLRDNLARAFAGSAKEVRAFVAYLVEQQAAADDRIAAGMAKARGAASDLSAAAAAKNPDVEGARTLLRGLSKHLEAKRALGEWKGDAKVFFPRGLTGVGTSAAEVVAALGVAREGFEKDKAVPDGAKLKKQITAAEKKLRKGIEATGGAAAAARSGLSEQSAEKKAWAAVYYGIAKIADGLFSIERRGESLATVVPHLAVSSRRSRRAKPKPDGAP